MARAMLVQSRRRLLGAAAGLLVLPVASRIAIAGPNPDAAEALVQQLVRRVFRIVVEGDLDQRSAMVTLTSVVEQRTDLTLLGRLILGRHWRRATPEQRAEYDRLFRDYMLRTFVQRLRPYAGAEVEAIDRRFRIEGSHPVSRRDVVVRSSLTPPSSPPLRVEWRVRQRHGESRVIDLVVESVSLLVAHRSEFAAVLDARGMDGLLAELRSRITQSV